VGVDVASFGDFFADLRPVSETQTIAHINKKSASADAGREKLGRAEIQVTVNEQPVKEQAVSRHRKRTYQPIQCLVYKDPFGSTYKKYIFTADGKYLLGGMMIGDVGDYVKLLAIVKKKVYTLRHAVFRATLHSLTFIVASESARCSTFSIHHRFEERCRR
jgi:nitrite reductase (NAD(P)H)